MDEREKNKQNIIIIWEGLSTIAGGQRVALNVMRQLKEKYQFKIIIPREGPLSSTCNSLDVPYDFIPMGNFTLGKKNIKDIFRFIYFTPFTLWRAHKIIKGADLIYANNTRVFIWSSIVGMISNVPVVWHLHNLLIDKKSRFLIELFGKFKIVKKIIAVSHATRNQFPKLKYKTMVIYNGIDISKFNKFKRKQNNSGQKSIGVIADLIPQKGHQTLIKAAKLLKEKLLFKIFIVGSERNGMKYYEKELKSLVRELRLSKNVEFLGYRTDIPDILNMLDLLVIPSSSFEACPMVALEAYACGVPVIGSNLGGTPELIEEGKTGFTFNANDEKDLAEKIELIFSNPKLYDEMKKNCREIAEEKFNLKFSCKKIKLILNNVLKRR